MALYKLTAFNHNGVVHNTNIIRLEPDQAASLRDFVWQTPETITQLVIEEIKVHQCNSCMRWNDGNKCKYCGNEIKE